MHCYGVLAACVRTLECTLIREVIDEMFILYVHQPRLFFFFIFFSCRVVSCGKIYGAHRVFIIGNNIAVNVMVMANFFFFFGCRPNILWIYVRCTVHWRPCTVWQIDSCFVCVNLFQKSTSFYCAPFRPAHTRIIGSL